MKHLMLTKATAMPCFTERCGGIYDKHGNFVEQSLFKNGDWQISCRSEYLVPKSKLDECVIWGGYCSSNYGHFLYETLTKLWFALDTNYPILFAGGKLKPWAQDILNYLGIQNKVIFIDNPTTVDRIIIPESGYVYCEEFKDEYLKLIGTFPYKKTVKGKRLFISRLQSATDERITGGATREQEQMMISILEKYGYELVIPEQLLIEEKLNLIADAETVVTFGGSFVQTYILLEKVDTNLCVLYRHGAGHPEHPNSILFAKAKNLKQYNLIIDQELRSASLFSAPTGRTQVHYNIEHFSDLIAEISENDVSTSKNLYIQRYDAQLTEPAANIIRNLEKQNLFEFKNVNLFLDHMFSLFASFPDAFIFKLLLVNFYLNAHATHQAEMLLLALPDDSDLFSRQQTNFTSSITASIHAIYYSKCHLLSRLYFAKNETKSAIKFALIDLNRYPDVIEKRSYIVEKLVACKSHKLLLAKILADGIKCTPDWRYGLKVFGKLFLNFGFLRPSIWGKLVKIIYHCNKKIVYKYIAKQILKYVLLIRY